MLQNNKIQVLQISGGNKLELKNCIAFALRIHFIGFKGPSIVDVQTRL